MRKFAITLLLAMAPLAASALAAAPAADTKVTVEQLEQALSEAHGRTDAEMAQALSGLELTERLSPARRAHLKDNLPGEKAQTALALLADRAEFLPAPNDELVNDPTPDAATTRAMLVKIVSYVNNTVRQLPNLMAVRETTGFEDRPKEDRQEANAVVSLSYLPLHLVGKSSIAVTYRDRKEVEDVNATKSLKHTEPIAGLATSGEFGPILTTVLADALKGKITWARWEQGASAKLAVFRYTVPGEKSNYFVKFCCILNGFNSDNEPNLQVFNERASYHGELVFNPADGSILRITLEAEMPAKGLVPTAGIAIEYGPVEIGGQTYICPTMSVSLLQAHVAVQQGMTSRANYQGDAKTYLNEVDFDQYRRFGSETRIVTENVPPAK